MTDRLHLADLDFSIIEPSQLDDLVASLMQANFLQHVVTVNPDFILLARKDSEFKNILASANLVTIDGAGIIFVAKLFGQKIKWNQRITGVQLTESLLKYCQQHKKRVAVILPDQSYSSPEQIAAGIKYKMPQLDFFIEVVSHVDAQSHPLNASVVFVALGAPQQDQWIAANRAKLRYSTVAVGVGGTFDFISGRIKRAPKFVQNLGLEWLWRFFLRPVRQLHRVIRSAIIFPLLMIFSKNARK